MSNGFDRADGTSASQPPSAIDPDILASGDIFEVLAHPRRRYLLYALSLDDQWTLSDLATTLAAWEQDTEEAVVDDRTRKRMYVSLIHSHIPELKKSEVIHFNEREKTIRPGAHTEDLLAILKGVCTRLDQRHEIHAHRDETE